jgi:hypothetical protein
MVFAILTIGALIASLALAVDYGLMMLDADLLQRACDAAALAGAQELDGSGSVANRSNAIEKANIVARQNGVMPWRVKDAFMGIQKMGENKQLTHNGSGDEDKNARITSIFFPDAYTIKVQAESRRPFLFASAVGVGGVSLSRWASAQYAPLKALKPGGGRPLAITETDYERYKDGGDTAVFSLARNSKNDFVSGGLLALATGENNGQSPSEWENAVRNGVSKTWEAGGKSGTALNAHDEDRRRRLANAIDGFKRQNGEAPDYFFLAIMPEARSAPGNRSHRLKGFAAVEVIGADHEGNLTVRFLNKGEIADSGLLAYAEKYADGSEDFEMSVNARPLRLIDLENSN